MVLSMIENADENGHCGKGFKTAPLDEPKVKNRVW